MLERSENAEQREPVTIIRFYEGTDDEPIAVIKEDNPLPVPSEGDSLILTDSRPKEAPGNPDIPEHEGEWDVDATIPPRRVFSVRHEYELANFPDEFGNEVEQLYTYVDVRLEPEEEV